MLAAILAAVLAATAPEGTLFTSDGGRVRGNLVEAGPAGVTLRLSDGSTRKFAPTEVNKVVFADGTQWRPGDPPPAVRDEVSAAPAAVAAVPAAAATQAAPPAATQEGAPPGQGQANAAAPAGAAAASVAAVAATAPPPPAGPMLIPAERLDTIFLASGGRARALVTEDTAEGVVVRLVDGTERRYAPGQVARIVYADGTVSERAAPPR